MYQKAKDRRAGRKHRPAVLVALAGDGWRARSRRHRVAADRTRGWRLRVGRVLVAHNKPRGLKALRQERKVAPAATFVRAWAWWRAENQAWTGRSQFHQSAPAPNTIEHTMNLQRAGITGRGAGDHRAAEGRWARVVHFRMGRARERQFSDALKLYQRPWPRTHLRMAQAAIGPCTCSIAPCRAA
jgi:hypothetical protein